MIFDRVVLRRKAERVPSDSEKNVLALAEIPSKDVLVGKLLGSLLSPLYKLAFVLDAAAKKEPESAEAPAEAAPAEAATAEA